MSEPLTVQEATDQLAEAIRASDAYRAYSALRATVMADETNRTLLKEYQRTQTRLQMAAVAGRKTDADDVERFNRMSSLLLLNAGVAQYLLAQVRLQQVTGEVFQRVTAAAELELELPGM